MGMSCIVVIANTINRMKVGVAMFSSNKKVEAIWLHYWSLILLCLDCENETSQVVMYIINYRHRVCKIKWGTHKIERPQKENLTKILSSFFFFDRFRFGPRSWILFYTYKTLSSLTNQRISKRLWKREFTFFKCFFVFVFVYVYRALPLQVPCDISRKKSALTIPIVYIQINNYILCKYTFLI